MLSAFYFSSEDFGAAMSSAISELGSEETNMKNDEITLKEAEEIWAMHQRPTANCRCANGTNPTCEYANGFIARDRQVRGLINEMMLALNSVDGVHDQSMSGAEKRRKWREELIKKAAALGFGKK